MARRPLLRLERCHGGYPRRPHPDSRLRLPVHPADRPARARARRLQRDSPLGHGRGVAARLRAQGHHPFGRAGIGHRGRLPPGRRRGLVARRAGARHLLRHAGHGGAARRHRGAGRGQGIRLRRDSRPRPLQAAGGHRGPRQRRGPRSAGCVDEPRRPRQRAARGLQADRLHPRRAAGRHGRRGARLLRLPVPPRGHPHPPGHAHLRPLRARHLRLRQCLDPRQHHRGRHRRRAPAGR